LGWGFFEAEERHMCPPAPATIIWRASA